MARKSRCRPTNVVRFFLAVLMAASAPLGLQACSLLPKDRATTFERQEDAGRVMVGTQTVAPFEDYIDALQPDFGLTSDKALAEAIPQTRSVRLRELRALSAAMRLAFPGAGAVGAGEDSAEEDSDEGSSGAGDAGDGLPEAPETNVPDAVERTLSALDALDPATIQIDPMLRYRAATALYQEVALLSSYVREAAVSPDTAPFIVRQLVTVLPSARRTPYDVHLTLGYYSADPRPLPITLFDQEAPREIASGSCVGQPVRVIPLFVTDNVETSLIQADRAGARDLGFATSGASSAVGFGLGARSYQEAQEESVSREVNSLLTIGRTADNVLSLRIGAAAVENGYHLVPRTFNVTALVLAPVTERSAEADVLPCRAVRYSLQAEWSDARSGEKLRASPPGVVAERIGRSVETGGADAGRLLDLAIGNDFSGFRHELERARRSDAEIERLWLQFVRAGSEAGWSAGSFELPAKRVSFFPRDTQWQVGESHAVELPRAAIVDDGKSATLRLAGARGLSEGTIEAWVRLESPTFGSADLLATAVAIDDGGRAATITFPSLRKLNPAATSAKVTLFHVPRLHRWSKPAGSEFWRADLPILDTSGAKPAAKPGPDFEVQSSSDQVRVTSAGRGQIALTFRRSKKLGTSFTSVHFTLHGGHVVAATPGLGESDAAHLAAVDTIYRLDLGGLVPGAKLRVEAWRSQGQGEKAERFEAAPVELFVVGPEPTDS